MPRLSVFMPAYRAENTVVQAMRSTLRSMPGDSELVVAVDGPDPATEGAVRSVRDPRVVVRTSERNLGAVECLRGMLAATDSELVARMDADDVSLPWRFPVQLKALERAEIVCGTGLRFGRGRIPRPSYPANLTHQEVGALLPFVNPLFHPSMVARRQMLVDANAYERPSAAEDYVLWLDALCNGARIHKVAAPVIAYRLSSGQISGAADYVERVVADPELNRAWATWAEVSGRPWLLAHGGRPGAVGGTRAQLEAVVNSVRPMTRRYARRQVFSAAVNLST